MPIPWVQVYFDLNLLCGRCVGVELSRARHRNALRAVHSLAQEMTSRRMPSSLDPPRLLLYEEIAGESFAEDCGGGIRFERGNILETDLSSATVIYLSSLCFSQDFVRQVAGALSPAQRAQICFTGTHHLNCNPQPCVSMILSQPCLQLVPWCVAGRSDSQSQRDCNGCWTMSSSGYGVDCLRPFNVCDSCCAFRLLIVAGKIASEAGSARKLATLQQIHDGVEGFTLDTETQGYEMSWMGKQGRTVSVFVYSRDVPG